MTARIQGRVAAFAFCVFALAIAFVFALFFAHSAGAGADTPQVFATAPIDEDGLFTNIDGKIGHGGASVQLPFMLRRIAASFGHRPGSPARVPNDGAFLRDNARHSIPTVTWIGHATLLVQMDHVTFLTDPIWSDRASPISFAGPPRLVEPGVAIEDLPPIDFVLISHNHLDHLDLDTLEKLAERDPATVFVIPRANAKLLEDRGLKNVRELDWGGIWSHEGVEVHCLPAQHWSRRGLFDERRSLWASWAVTGAERRFYFGGDTGYFSGFARIGEVLGPFDLAAIPIGAYLPVEMMKDAHVNPEEAVQAGIDLRARNMLGIHYGTFDLSDEPLDEPPRRFREAGAANGLDAGRIWLLEIGETRHF